VKMFAEIINFPKLLHKPTGLCLKFKDTKYISLIHDLQWKFFQNSHSWK